MDAKKIWISPLQCLLSSLLLLHLAGIVGSSSLESDLTALLKFRSDSDPTGRLATWNGSAPVAPCGSWYGVACTEGRVTRIVLEGLGLFGPIATLTQLDQLRILSLKSNNLSGPIPDLTHLPHLKLLFLSDNAFSGPIPTSLASLPRLYRLDLSSNNLTGLIPAATLRSLDHLLTLRLSDNRLSGPISSLSLPNLQDLNLSSNLLSGAIPATLASFPAAAFTGNPSLCGAPLSSPCTNLVSDPATSASAPLPPASAIITSFPSTKPQTGAPMIEPRSSPTTSRRISREAVVVIVVADIIVLVVVSGVLFCYFWRKFRFSARSPSRLQEGEKIVYSTRPYATAGGSSTAAAGDGIDFERGAQMVFLEGAKRFELEDLLRASAEMLGKGGYGTAYKAVLGDGSAVAVKRLRDVHVTGKREFEQQMEALGQLRHPNLVQLKAYYFAGDEKLLVYEFMPNGSLFALLHGNRGPGRMPLDWTTRIRIAAGVAKGLAFIHQATKLAHGNVKSTNVLLDKEGNARLADVGLAMLGPPAAAGRCGGYRAPEAPPDGRRAWSSQRADVYAFGVVVLELLTGRPADGGGGGGGVVDLPRWAASVVREEWTAEVFDLELMRYKGIEEEMVAMLQVAMACTAASPDQRPGIGHVLRTIEEMRGGDVSPSQGSYDSISDSPSVSEDAAGSQ